MANKPKSRKRKPQKSAAPRHPQTEDRRSVVITVAWMLTTFATLGAELASLFTSWLAPYVHAPPGKMNPFLLLPGLTFFVALVSGMVVLLLTPLVFKFREEPPPPVITVAALFIALAPLGFLLFLSN